MATKLDSECDILILLDIFINLCKNGCRIIIYDVKDDSYADIKKKISNVIPECLVQVKPIIIKNNSSETSYELTALDSRKSITLYKLFSHPQNLSKLLRWGNYEVINGQDSIDNLVHSLYTKNDKQQITANDKKIYKDKLWNLMHINCFKSVGYLYVIICNRFLINDIKKQMFEIVLDINKWKIMDFYVSVKKT